MNTMRAAVLREFGKPLIIENKKLRTTGRLLVKVTACGVCHSDLHIQQGEIKGIRLPLVMGHEIAGFYEGLGNVLVYPSFGCGKCGACIKGDEQLCDRGSSLGWELGGGYAEYVAVPSKRYLMPFKNISPEKAAPLMDAGITPYRVVRRLSGFIKKGSDVLVMGAGALGLFAVQYLKLLYNPRIMVSDFNMEKLKLASDFGAKRAVSPKDIEGSFDAVFDFVGSNDTIKVGTESLRKGGAMALVGEYGGSVRFGLNSVRQEAWLTTSVWGSIGDAKDVIKLADSGRIGIPVTPMPLDNANEALRTVRDGKVIGRIVLKP